MTEQPHPGAEGMADDTHPPLPEAADWGSSEWARVSLLALAAGALGFAVNVREGLYQGWAILALTLAVAACLGAIFVGRPRNTGPERQSVPLYVLAVGLILQFVLLYLGNPGTITNVKSEEVAPLSQSGKLHSPSEIQRLRGELDAATQSLNKLSKKPRAAAPYRHRAAEIKAILNATRFQIALLIAGVLAILSLAPWRRLGHSAFFLLLIAHFLLGAWVIRTTPNPHIDVFVFQQESCEALRTGNNPYAATFSNIYGQDAFVYAPELLSNDGRRVLFGYPYTPVSLLLAMPGYLVGGDHRYSQLAAITLSALLLAFARPSLLAKLAALLLLFTPRIFMIVELAWTEPLVVLLLSATLFCACRLPWATPFVFGLFLASKQYLLFAIPLSVLLLRRPFSMTGYLLFLAKGAAVGLLISLPLVLWNLQAFIHSAVTLQLVQPFRNDSLSYLAFIWWNLHREIPLKLTWLAFAAVLPAIAAALWRFPRSPGGFAAALAIVYLVFLIFNKQAFCNYYFFVIATLCWAVALLDETVPEQFIQPQEPPAAGIPQRLDFNV